MQIPGGKFALTGGSGFIGSHVADALVERGADIVVLDKVIREDNLDAALRSGRVRVEDGDITDRNALERVFEGVDGVFHLAVLPLGPCLEQPRACLDVNVVGTFNVLEAAHAAGVTKVVLSSASSVYGDTPETMNESHPLEARTLYGASKIAGEFFVRAFNDMYGLDYVALRYMNVYGTRQEGGLIMSVLRRIESGEPPVIAGDGSQSFDFVDVRDVAEANVRAMESKVSDEVFNVGSGTEVTVREIVERLIRIAGSDLTPEYDREQRVLMTRRVGSSEKASRLLDWEARYGIDEGLEEVVRWTRAGSPAGAAWR